MDTVVADQKDGRKQPAAAGQDEKKTEKKEDTILGKTIGEWIKILREHESPKYRRAALIALEYGNAATRTGLATIVEAVEKDKDPQVRREAVMVLGRLGPEAKGSLKALGSALQNDKAENVREAVADFLAREREGVAGEQLYLGARTPFKKG